MPCCGTSWELRLLTAIRVKRQWRRTGRLCRSSQDSHVHATTWESAVSTWELTSEGGSSLEGRCIIIEESVDKKGIAQFISPPLNMGTSFASERAQPKFPLHIKDPFFTSEKRTTSLQRTCPQLKEAPLGGSILCTSCITLFPTEKVWNIS